MSEMEHDDRELRERFAALRDKDGGSTPPFVRVLGGRPARHTRRWLQPVMALGAVALVAVAIATWKRPAVEDEAAIPPELAMVTGSLRMPTDYFLDVVTSVRADEITNVPSIGAVDWYPLVPAIAPVTGTSRRN